MPSITLASAVAEPTWRVFAAPRAASLCSPQAVCSSQAAAAAAAGWGLSHVSSAAGVVCRSMSEQQESSSSSSSVAVMPLWDVYDFICRGPLLDKVGLNRESVREGINEWLECGLRLSRILGFRELFLSDSEKSRIYHYYLPVFMWCKKQLELHRSGFKDGEQVPALVIGISAPQGCGKTTLVDALEYLFNSSGRSAASVSIDDFYLTASDQSKLATAHKGNALLELRGNAGSHDLQLGSAAIQSLRLLSEGMVASIPHYDKSAHKGRGDRSDPSTWTRVQGPLQVLLFEGWMLGFKPVDSSIASSVDPQLEVVNKNLAAYQEAWFNLVDSWIIVQVETPQWVFQWRLQAEIAMKAAGKSGMSDEEVADFVSRYMPAYKAYLPSLYSDGPMNAKPERLLNFVIDKQRNPVA